MTPYKITITITDSPDCTKCNADLSFSPALKRGDVTPAIRAATIFLEKLKAKSTLIQTSSLYEERDGE